MTLIGTHSFEYDAHVTSPAGQGDGQGLIATPKAKPACWLEQAESNGIDFGRLYQQHAAGLLNYVYRRTGDRHATEDLVADVFVIVMRALPGYRDRGVPIQAWLFRIATNTVNRWARRQRRRRCVTLEDNSVGDSRQSSTPGSAMDERFQAALLSLPPRYQAVLALHHMEGLSVKETAVIVGCREGTVRSRLARARDALRIKLQRRR